MGGKTVIWVQGSVLAQALGKEKPKSKKEPLDLDRNGGNWGWSRCELINGDISALDSSTLGVRIFDEGSEYHGESVTIDAALLKPDKNTGVKVVMANEWAAAEVSGEGEVRGGLPPDDLITLTHLHEPSVVFCLRRRYENDLIYTATGPILIALNPFKGLPSLYDDSMMNDHWMSGEGVADLNLKPHIYQNAHAAFRSMMQGIEMQSTGLEEIVADQSMLVSGESGAGKTVTTKHVMKYLATLSQRKAEFSKRRRDASPGRSEPRGARRNPSMRASRAMSWKAGVLVEERILESNPILEAFGNARTIRNDNSSRFGKLIELQFKQTGSLVGSRIETYLLEKVRLVHQSEGERNYHIFYELLAATTDEERKTLMLGDYQAQDFKMTNSSGTYDRRDGEADDELYDELIMAMGTIGFNGSVQQDILCCCSAFLHAFNLTFSAPTEESSKVDDSNPHLEPTLQLLGLDKDAFNSAMTEYELEIGSQTFTRQLTAEGAEKALEAFVKGTYGAMFSFIVNTVNKRIDYKPARGVPKLLGKAASISVLDIFGFESFELNSFEQLCINYCNEALQQQFNLFIFKNEQAEYEKEGIRWDLIEFPDNSEVIELIDKKGTGLLSILTDQCRQPRTTDQTFLAAIYKACEKHERFINSALHKGKGQFVINHYAGAVMYDSEGFIQKNKDETPRGASALLESSTKELVQLLGKITAGGDAPAPTKSSGGRSSKKRPTVGSQFSAQLTELRSRIDQTRPHYIRCLKPNQSLQPNDFENAMVADQLRYAGVLEAIRVSRVGYSQRYSKASFLERYRFIAVGALKKAQADQKVDILVGEIAKRIWADQNPGQTPPGDINDAAGIQKGATKVFLRQHAFDNMEKLRTIALTVSAIKIQSVARRFVFRCRFHRRIRSIVMGQASARRFLARKYLKAFRERRAVVRIQAVVRLNLAHRKFLATKAAAVGLQKFHRGCIARKDYKILYEKSMKERKERKAAITIQCVFRIIAAGKIYEHTKTIVRRPSKMVAKLQGKALKAAIQSDKAAAVAKEAAKERAKEVDSLTSRLAGENVVAEKARSALEELHNVKAELAAALAELEQVKLEAEEASGRAEKLEEENATLQEKLESGVFLSGEPYKSRMYSDYPDLEALDKQMFEMKSRSKKSKEDLTDLISVLSILK